MLWFTNNSLSYTITLLICVIASYPGFYPQTTLNGLALLHSLQALASAPPSSLTVALASNVCVDLVVPAKDVLLPAPLLSAEHGSTDRAFLSTLADLSSAFTFHAHAGAAGERSSSPAVMAALLGPAEASPSARHILGGNAALMAQKLASQGVRVVLGGRIGPKAAALLHPAIQPATPQAPADDTHLILEYQAGQEFLGVPAPRANRFIVTTGVPEDAPLAVAQAVAQGAAQGAGVLVLSGLHALENLPAQQRAATLAAIAAALATRPPTLPVHVELASVASAEYLAAVCSAILTPHAASLGFNEGEAAALYEALGGNYSSAKGSSAPGLPKDRAELTALVPKVASVASLLRHLFRALPLLTRAHFHCLAHHIVVHRVGGSGGGAAAGAGAGAGSPSHGPWSSNPAGAAAAGALACATQACDTSVAGATQGQFYALCPTRMAVGDVEVGSGVTVVRRLSTSSSAAGSGGRVAAEWQWPLARGGGEEGQQLHFAAVPVPVCASPTRTVGLGDAVSAAALGADMAA